MLPILKVNEDITLRFISLDDVDAVFHVMDTQKDYIGAFLPFAYMTKEPEDTKKFIKSCLSDIEKDLAFVYTILYKGSFTGLISNNAISRAHNKVDIGYWLNQNYQKKGIITQCVDFFTEYLLGEQGFNRIVIRCATTNPKSRAIPERLGYSLEGIEREAAKAWDGTYLDMCVYSKIKKDSVVDNEKV